MTGISWIVMSWSAVICSAEAVAWVFFCTFVLDCSTTPRIHTPPSSSYPTPGACLLC